MTFTKVDVPKLSLMPNCYIVTMMSSTTQWKIQLSVVFGVNGSQLAKMKKSIPEMSLP